MTQEKRQHTVSSEMPTAYTAEDVAAVSKALTLTLTQHPAYQAMLPHPKWGLQPRAIVSLGVVGALVQVIGQAKYVVTWSGDGATTKIGKHVHVSPSGQEDNDVCVTSIFESLVFDGTELSPLFVQLCLGAVDALDAGGNPTEAVASLTKVVAEMLSSSASIAGFLTALLLAAHTKIPTGTAIDLFNNLHALGQEVGSGQDQAA